MAERFLERLTWPEVEEAIGRHEGAARARREEVAPVMPRIVQVCKEMSGKE